MESKGKKNFARRTAVGRSRSSYQVLVAPGMLLARPVGPLGQQLGEGGEDTP